MKPREITDEDIQINPGLKKTFACPPTMPDCKDVEVIVQKDRLLIPWLPDGEDLERIQAGSTIWLSVWGHMLPPVAISVD